MKRDAYEILGISRSSNENDIKKAYKLQAMKNHPDKNQGNPQAEELFKEINEAYSVLSDPQKKSIYDLGGWDALNGGTSSSTNNNIPPFFNMPNFFNPMGGINLNMNMNMNRPKKANPIIKKVIIPIEELYNGVTKLIEFTKQVVCSKCNGTGSKSQQTNKCSNCNGTGNTIQIKIIPPGIMQHIQTMCGVCNGTGDKNVDVIDRCEDCNGSKIITKDSVQLIQIIEAIPNFQTISIIGLGNEIPNGITGDLVIEIEITYSKLWKRESNDSLNLVHLMKIGLYEHYTDEYIHIFNLDNSILKIPKKNISPKVTTFTIPDKGLKKGDIRGHIIVIIDIQYPDDLKDCKTNNLSIPEDKTIYNIETIINASTVSYSYFKTFENKKDSENNTNQNSSPECKQQ